MKHFIFSIVLMAFVSVATFAREPQPERTDWFVKHGYGVFVHYLNKLQNNPEHVASLGKSTSWDECVNEFNVELFADRMKETGAGYVIFTVLQRERFLIAPNETFNQLTGYQTGEACAGRDLIEELYQALNKRGIDLMLYFTGDSAVDDPKARQGLSISFPVQEEFVRKWASVAAEYGERYKDKIKGYWVDGSYEFIGYNDHLLGIFAEGLRAGYPERILAFNPGVEMRAYSVHDDFTAGEMNSFELFPPNGRFLDGTQWHILSFLGTSAGNISASWGQPGTCQGKQELAEYVWQVNSLGGVVSIDVLLYRDGEMDRSQLEVLKPLRQNIAALDAIRYAWKEGKAIPANNIAWRKPAALKSNDGQRFLIPSVGPVHAARYGNDGNRRTTAIGAGNWAWTYEIDLLEPVTISRVVVHFGSGYATDLEVCVVDPQNRETSLGRFTDQKGESLDLKFEPKESRWIRVRAHKPDGPDQPGTQMSVAEVEVYEPSTTP
ncbi:MAG: alpha-L-fucosidase [Planctomycetaceae bacterium]|nr:alpha-L-fucosidase [Planctomycetaceae bacterium]